MAVSLAMSRPGKRDRGRPRGADHDPPKGLSSVVPSSWLAVRALCRLSGSFVNPFSSGRMSNDIVFFNVNAAFQVDRTHGG